MEQNEPLPAFPTDMVPVQSVYQANKDFMRKYKTNVIKWLSLLQTSIGILIIILGIINVSIPLTCFAVFCHVGYGIWYGILYSAAGIVGVCSVRFHPHRKLVFSNMILNIIAASLSLISFFVGLDGVVILNSISYWNPELNIDPSLAVSSLLLIFIIFQIIVCIVSASFSCKAICQCCNESREFPNYAIFDEKTKQFIFVAGIQASYEPSSEGTHGTPASTEIPTNQASNTDDQFDYSYLVN